MYFIVLFICEQLLHLNNVSTEQLDFFPLFSVAPDKININRGFRWHGHDKLQWTRHKNRPSQCAKQMWLKNLNLVYKNRARVGRPGTRVSQLVNRKLVIRGSSSVRSRSLFPLDYRQPVIREKPNEREDRRQLNRTRTASMV